MIFIICKNISHRIFLSLCSALGYSCSVLAYYQITQVLGLMESLGLLLSILFVWSLYIFIDRKQLKYYNYALLLYFAVCFVHERYIPYIFVLFAMLCIAEWRDKRKIYIFSTLGIVVSIFALRFIALHNIGFTGTGGTNIADTLSIMTFLKFVCFSIGYIFGVNYGHPAMSLFSFSAGWNDYHIIDWILVLIPILCVVILFVLFLLSQKNKKISDNKDIKILLLFLLCIGINLCSASVTIRVELRWIYTPFSIMLLALSFIATHIRFRYGLYFGVCMLLCTICFNVSHRQYFSRLYYWPTLCFGEELYKYTVGNHGNNIDEMDIILIMNQDDFPNWDNEYLSTFFAQYFETENTICRISNIDDLAEQILSGENLLLLRYHDMTFEEISVDEAKKEIQ